MWPKSVVRQVDLDREERRPPPRGFAAILTDGRVMETLREVVREAMSCGFSSRELVRCAQDLWEEERANF